MPRITTVKGDIAPEQLGFTSMHEHTMLDLRPAAEFIKSIFPDVTQEMVEFKFENFAFLKTGAYLLNEELAIVDDMDFLAQEYGFFKELGGQSICDCSPIGIRGNIRDIQRLSERTGLHIVCATGFYTETARPPELIGKGEDVLYRAMKKEVEEGIDGTEIRPGILKCALATYGNNGLADGEIAALRACARLSAETGMSVHVHTDAMLAEDDVFGAIEMAVKECGAQPDRILVCHMDNRIAGGVMVSDYLENPDVDRTLSLELQERLLDLGVNIGLDTWGMPIVSPQFFMPDDFERLKALVTLLNKGYGAQITLGNDFSSKFMGRTYGHYGCTRFAGFALPMLRDLYMEEHIRRLTVENPARILSY